MEFKEIMEQWARLCKCMGEKHGVHKCNHCKLNPLICKFTPNKHCEHIEKTEEFIIEWAKEHPKPKYPTWLRWLVKQKVLMSENCFHFPNLMAAVYQPGENLFKEIPQEIAEALGIPPEENEDV